MTDLPSSPQGDVDGFTIVEVVVVCVIIGLLLAIAGSSLATPRKVASEKQLHAAAAHYKNAVTAFQLDHGGRVPTIGTADWPVAKDGPLDISEDYGGGKFHRYMRGVAPDAVMTGATGFGSGTAAEGTVGRLIYTPAARDFTIAVDARTKTGWKNVCVVSDAGGANEC